MGQYDTTTDVRMGDPSFREISTTEGSLRLLNVTPSKAEHLLIWRRRQGMTQPEAASFLSLGLNTYKEIERGTAEYPLKEIPYIGELYSYEICLIMRRRSGWTILMCAEQIGISRYWYNLMEQGKASPETLIRYWSEDEG